MGSSLTFSKPPASTYVFSITTHSLKLNINNTSSNIRLLPKTQKSRSSFYVVESRFGYRSLICLPSMTALKLFWEMALTEVAQWSKSLVVKSNLMSTC